MKYLGLPGLIGPSSNSRLKDTAAATLSIHHDSLREGTALGIMVATAIWVWLAVVDAVAGQPFHTFTVLGGVTAFTTVHYLLNIAYGLAIVSAIHGAKREPSLVLAVVFGVVILEIAIAMLTILLSHLGLGELAWVGIFGGSLIGLVIALFVLSLRHPLAAQLRDADRDHDAGGPLVHSDGDGLDA
jgi:hypothetical protein